ncbi:MAG: hypothetical protein JXB48_14185 [Candidatus Latescibacteria bacterium]|nr:hypothetical protein [Candidatus Latescibacterota bacterium]
MQDEVKQEKKNNTFKIVGWIVVGLVIVSLGGFSYYQYQTITQKNNQVSQLTEEKKSLEDQKSSLNTKIDEITSTIDEIAARIQDVRQRTVVITQLVAQTAEGGKKDQILGNIAAVENQLVQDKKDIEGLMVKMEKSGIRIKSLEAVVKTLKNEITGHVERIENLRSIVEHKNEVIRTTENALDATKNELTITQASLDMTEQELSATKNTLKETINTAYYLVGTKNQLKELNVIDEKGWLVFNKGINLSANINEKNFQRIDITEQREFPIACNAEDVRILPERDVSSYKIEVVEKNKSVLKITDPEKFWKIKYLAVMVKGSDYQAVMLGNETESR